MRYVRGFAVLLLFWAVGAILYVSFAVLPADERQGVGIAILAIFTLLGAACGAYEMSHKDE